MNKTITLQYNRSIIWQAIRRHFMRYLGVHYWVNIAVLILIISFLYTLGTHPILLDICLVALATSFILALLAFGMMYHQLADSMKMLENARCDIVLKTENYTFLTEKSVSTFAWSTIKKIWQYDELWIMMVSKHTFWVLPLKNLEPEDKEFITSQVQQASSNVR